ncbi:MAG: glycosyltransferase family 2 protein [Chloroflexi bacterium]|nr:glycosyltransferase family 2 protein [Chloroflexota bacterium]
MKLSILIPAYNERGTIAELLRQVQEAPLEGLEREIIVVDDGSADGTTEILQSAAEQMGFQLLLHDRNMGKGAAIQTALDHATGDIVLVQDADLEYDPQDYPRLLRPILVGRAQAVYGSRFLGEHKAMYFWHSLGNHLINLVANILYDTTLTDLETGYKVFTAEVAGKLRLRSRRWGFDPEITARILRSGYRIYEVPISYFGREYWEGKKITWRDGLVVLFTLVRCRFFD